MKLRGLFSSRMGGGCFLQVFLLLAGCGGGGTEVGNPDGVALTQQFANDQELENYVKEQFASSVVPFPAPGDPLNPGAGAGDPPPAHSDTNIQEAGVDEADKVKTDGNYLYVAQQDGVRVVRLGPEGAMSAVSKVTTGGPVDSLYLHNSVLVVLYRPSGGEGTDWCSVALPATSIDVGGCMPCWIPAKARTGIRIVNVADPMNPVQLSDRIFDGELVSSRRIENNLHLVSRFVPDLPILEYYYDGTEAGREAVVQRNRNALQGLTFDELIPTLETRDAAGNLIQSGPLLGRDEFLRPSRPQGGSIATVLTIDLNRSQEEARVVGGVLDAREVYASTSALYLGAGSWGRQETILHKFDLTGSGAVYAASGSVPGQVLNQFSLGEYQGVLRVATTTGFNSSNWVNHVFCLRPAGAELSIVGRLENLAPGEKLYSARFMGTRGFLVTFVKVDPLFTLDLADPSEPKVAGELKVPGYSDYIHPLGEDFLLTIGKDAIAEGGITWYQGLQLSIFDVSEFANPVLLFREVIGDRGTRSEAAYDHKAFTYWAEAGLLALPVDLYEHQIPQQVASDFGQYTFSGLYVYRVDPVAGFTFLGRMDTRVGEGAFPAWTRGLFAGESVFAATAPKVSSAQVVDIANTVISLDIGNQ